MLARWITLPLKALCLGFGLWFISVFLYIVTISLLYPFPLEWMEGHTIDIMQRLLDGKPFYAKPTLEYVPYIYTPYYFYLSAFAGSFLGVDFFAARLVSIISIIAVGCILFSWIRKEGGGALAAFITAGLFFATYKVSGRWFDVARVDSLYLLCMVAGLYIYTFGKSVHHSILAGTFFAIAFFTKQSAILAVFPAFLAALYLDWKRALHVAITSGLLIIIGCIYLHVSSEGWFSFYTYDVPSGHVNDYRQVKLFWTRDLFASCLIMMSLGMFAILFMFKEKKTRGLWYASITLGFLASSYISRIHSYGHINVVIPTYFVFALLSGLILTCKYKHTDLAKLFFYALIAGQFYTLLYDYKPLIPNARAEENSQRFIERISKTKGEILFTELQFIQTKAGKKSYSIGMAGFDILRAKLGDKRHIKHEYRKHISDAVAQKRFSAIVAGNFIRVNNLYKHYRVLENINKPQEFITGGVYFNRGKIFVPRNRFIKGHEVAK